MAKNVPAEPTPEEVAASREQVESRVKDESSTAAPEESVITHAFVKKCVKAEQKGDGILFSVIHRNRFVCVPELKHQWFEWNGSSWRQVFLHRVESAVEAVVQQYEQTWAYYTEKKAEAEKEDEKEIKKKLGFLCEKLRARINYLRKREGVSACISFALANDNPLTAEVWQFDADPWLFGVANGVIDLRTGEHRQANPTDMIRRTTNVEWQGIDQPCPTWEAYIKEIVGDDEEVAGFLQRVFGYAITGLSCEALFLVLAGEGRNGKSVLMRILGKVCGDYMAPIPAELLLDQGQNRDADKPTPTLMSLRGLRIAHAAETDDNRKFSISRVKWLSGDDQIVGRYPWDRENTCFDPTHLLFLLTNNIPHAGAHEYAFWDRLRLVLFPFRYVDNPREDNERQRDRTLPGRLETELPGILAWIVKGCLLYQRDGIAAPQAVLAATEKQKREEDHIQDFVDECLERFDGDGLPDPERRTNAMDIYELYARWHIKNRGKYVPSSQIFGRHLGKKIHKERRGGNIYYYDVRIRPESFDKYPEPEAKGKRYEKLF